ncbi:MAG: hypothetical protein WC617_16560 [Rhodanobacter sp.]|jgi:hypothetical protein
MAWVFLSMGLAVGEAMVIGCDYHYNHAISKITLRFSQDKNHA